MPTKEMHPFRRYRGDTRPTDDELDDPRRYRSDFRRWKRFDTDENARQNAESYGQWRPPYGSVDAGYFLRGGRYLGCGVTLLMLIFPAVILFYGIRAVMFQAINYELDWLPLSTLQCGTALAIFTFAPLLPFRLWMLFTAINKDNQDTQQEKPMPTRARQQSDEWNGWGKEETRDFLKSRSLDKPDKGAGYLVMAGLFMEAAAMKRLVPSLSRLKYTLSDDELKTLYEAEGEWLQLLQQAGGKRSLIHRWQGEDRKRFALRRANHISPLHLALVVEEAEEEKIQEKIDKAQGRKEDKEKKESPQLVQWIFWIVTVAIRLVGYVLMPVILLKWLSMLLSRDQFGDAEQYSRSRDNGTAANTPNAPRPLPMTTHQSAVLEILKLQP
ncbi:MAG: hypothetical protein KC496_15840, partial [Anaerolineae bacterium]|nr:hypothetical protein [Anaerolineae bacterium]